MTRMTMLGRLGAAVLGFHLAATGAQAATASVDGPRATALKRMIDRFGDKHYTAARNAAQSLGDPAALEAYEWLRLRQPGVDNFERMARWVEAHPGWPDQKRIQSQGERALKPGNYSVDRIIAFFDRFPPYTGRGAVEYARALSARGFVSKANTVAADAWTTKDLDSSDEQRLVAQFGAVLAPLHDQRLDRLIWRTRLTAARRQLPRVSGPARALGRARIALLKNEGGVDRLVKAVPASLKSDPGLAYARMIWRDKRGLRHSAETMMLEMSRVSRLGNPEKWADERALFVREALDTKRYSRAYELAATHGLTAGEAYAGLEWIAGWIALRKLNDPKAAMTHFTRLHAGVKTPVSKARAAFWAGEAAMASGNKEAADRWRREGSKYQSAFYGQLASERLSGSAMLSLPPETAATPGGCTNDRRVSVGAMLALGGAIVPARKFFYDVAELCNGPGELKALAQIAEQQGALRISIGLSRKARKGGVFMPEISHPLVQLPRQGCRNQKPPEFALTLAIARQESGFHAEAGSEAGAQGIMQVMPGTAKRTVSAAGLSYSRSRLGSDGEYNSIIGQCYLTQMLDRFNGSYPLAIAAYNAGPRRVDDWLRRNGDPRSKSVETIDWVEAIPFRETRNYVQRVLEGVAIYRARLR